MACSLTSLLLVLLLTLLFVAAAAEDLKLVPFAETTLDYPIGEKVVQLFAADLATVQDLKANIGSDAVWLKEENDDGLGEYLDGDIILHDIPDLESKMLNVVVSDAFGDRPGNATQVDIRDTTTTDDRGSSTAATQKRKFSSSILLVALSSMLISLVLTG